MKQMSLNSPTEFECESKRTSKREILDEIDLVAPWSELVVLAIMMHLRLARKAAPHQSLSKPIYRIHLLKQSSLQNSFHARAQR